MEIAKLLHVSCAYLTGLGFLVRGAWTITENSLASHKLTKRLPHIVDTLLLASGIMMTISWQLSPTEQPWLAAKLIALLVYIGFGLLMLRFARRRSTKIIGLIGGILSYGFIVFTAHNKFATFF